MALEIRRVDAIDSSRMTLEILRRLEGVGDVTEIGPWDVSLPKDPAANSEGIQLVADQSNLVKMEISVEFRRADTESSISPNP